MSAARIFSGHDGYVMFGIGVSALPSYVSTVTPLAGLYAGNGNYASVDNPSSPGSYIQTGVVFFNGQAANAEDDMFSFTLTGTVPAAFAISVMVDNSDAP